MRVNDTTPQQTTPLTATPTKPNLLQRADDGVEVMGQDATKVVTTDRTRFDRFVRSSLAEQNTGHGQMVANVTNQLPLAGNTSKIEDLLPTFVVNWGKKIGLWAQNKGATSTTRIGQAAKYASTFSVEHPTAFSRLGTAARVAGPLMAIGSLGWSVAGLATQWDKLTPGAKTANVAATAATAVGAGGAVAALAGVAHAGNIAWAGLGAAGAIYQGIATWQDFHNPKMNTAQRGLSLISTVMQGAGACLMWTPFGGPLMVAGSILGMFGNTIGKIPFVNDAFKWMAKGLAPVTKAIAPVAKAIGDGVAKAGEAIGHGLSSAAHAVGNFFSGL